MQLLKDNRELYSYVYHQFISKGLNPSATQLKELVGTFTANMPSVRIIIDGLDEYDEKDQKKVLETLLPLCNLSTTTCKILISSTDVTQIGRVLRKKTNICLSEELPAISEAIRSFVHKSLLELQDKFDDIIISENDVADMERTITERSKGTRMK